MTAISMTTKQELIQWIEDCKHRQLIEADMRKVIAEMQHYKQVNKRFTDRFTELGYHAYIIKDYSTKLCVRKQIESYNWAEIVINVYGQELTWQLILAELSRNNYAVYQAQYEERLAKYDQEIEDVKQFYEVVKEYAPKLKNFTLYRVESDLKYILMDLEKSGIRIEPKSA